MYAIYIQTNNDPTALPSHYCSYTRLGDALAAVTDEITEQFDLAALYPLPVEEAAEAVDVDGKVTDAWIARVSGSTVTDTIVVVDDGEPPVPATAYSGYLPSMGNERRTANGDLTFDHTDDKIVMARNNLRYWIDRAEGTHGAGGTPPVVAAAQWMVATIDREYANPGPAAVDNGNTTRYAEKWMECNRALMAALANPSQVAFDRAATYATLTIGNAYSSTNEGVEWEMAQSLNRMVVDVARECGYKVGR